MLRNLKNTHSSSIIKKYSTHSHNILKYDSHGLNPTSFNLKDLSLKSRGELGTMEYTLNCMHRDENISWWHNIPLVADEKQTVFHYINEIPEGTRRKMEINTEKSLNPIQQDVKNNQPRVFKFGDIPINYGCFPQSWEDPHITDPNTDCLGDNDPVDVCLISGDPHAKHPEIGTITPVKLLGAYCLIDDGETDWKMIVVSMTDPGASHWDHVHDLPSELRQKILDWFRLYKTADGKPENRFGLNGEPLSKHQAMEVMRETHEQWQRLVAGDTSPGKLWIPSSKY